MNDLENLFKELSIKPKNISLYKRAFTHSSYANEHKGLESYERLEFLGDAIVDLVVADYLYENYSENEGEMTKVRASYVCEDALYEYSIKLHLDKLLLVGQGELSKDLKSMKASISDIFESLCAAIYLDLGFATVRRVVLKIVTPYIKKGVKFFEDYKSALQEAVQTEKESVIYNLVNEEGPSHDKKFTVEAVIDGIVYGRGTAKSKKEAEMEAAKEALAKLAV